MRVIGLMSGTSLDGIDAALIDIDGTAQDVQWSLRAFVDVPFSTAQRSAIHDAIAHGSAERLCRINADLGEWLADAAARVVATAGLRLEDVDLIGSHGQTLWHIPPVADHRGATLQLGCAATIAERTGISVVSDFRSRDVAAYGQGAPLVPWADRLLFAHADHARVLINIGGMANLTWVPPRGEAADVLAFDTGPGNALIDAAIEAATGGERIYDQDGAMARAGIVDEAVLASLLQHAFFQAPPPRSTGREVFGRAFVQDLIHRSAQRTGKSEAEAAGGLVATLSELTARTIADALLAFVPAHTVAEAVVTGGGARNTFLMERLASLLHPMPVIGGSDVGIDGDAKEAIVFGALAWAHVRGIPGNIPTATGSSGPRVLGSMTPGRNKGH